MKSFFKRSIISLVVLGMAGSGYAASQKNVSNNSSWCPQVSGAFIGVEGLDLRPQNGDLDYVTLFPSSSAGSFNTDAISTSYHWGWRVYGGLKITENDDLTLSWMQLNSSQSDSVSPNNTGLGAARFLDSFILGPSSGANWASVLGHVTFDLKDAYVVWGHTIYFNNPWSVRFAGGFEWAKINSNLTVTANTGADPSGGIGAFPINTDIGFTAENQTKGFGPRVEFDMTYHLPYGFALFGNANGALLVSTRDISLNPNNTSILLGAGPIEIPFFESNFSNRHVVIPKFGARLGASYTYVWGQAGGEGCRTTTLMVDAGWQVESYIHAIERPVDAFTGEQIESSLTQSQIFTNGRFAETKVSNFGDQGLFIGIQLGTDWM